MKRAFSRRDFLNWAGAVGGSTAVYRAAMGMGLLPIAARATPLQLTASGKSKKVLILGAGISGLTSAYELSKQGLRGAGARGVVPRRRPQHDACATATASTRPAIRRSATSTRTRTCTSTAVRRAFPGHHVNLLGYCKELGVELEPFINDNRNAWVQDDAMFGGKPIRAREYLNDTRGFVAELMAKSMKPEQIAGADDARRLGAAARIPASISASSIRSSRYIGTSRAGLAKHDYTAPEVLKTPLVRQRAAQVASSC